MELEVSTWTRRERLERIASAERDRRRGRPELALASLGASTEWPARVVLALARLPEMEGAETRAILEATLDRWAEESGLEALDVPVVDPYVEADRRNTSLDAPIELDELEEAFAHAEAQTDEMLDVNTVAERVLMDEPVGLSEVADERIAASIETPTAAAEHESPGPSGPEQTDAAWSAGSIWPEPIAALPNASEAFDVGPIAADDGPPAPATGSRQRILATLEGWLANLEQRRRESAR